MGWMDGLNPDVFRRDLGLTMVYVAMEYTRDDEFIFRVSMFFDQWEALQARCGGMRVVDRITDTLKRIRRGQRISKVMRLNQIYWGEDGVRATVTRLKENGRTVAYVFHIFEDTRVQADLEVERLRNRVMEDIERDGIA